MEEPSLFAMAVNFQGTEMKLTHQLEIYNPFA